MKYLLLFLLAFTICNSFGQVCNYPALDNKAVSDYLCKGTLQINGKISNTGKINLTSLDGDVIITGKIDSGSIVTITAKRGRVTIQKKIDEGAIVKIICRDDISIQGKIDGGANCDFYSERGAIQVKDLVADLATVIKYHSMLPPDWGKSISVIPISY